MKSHFLSAMLLCISLSGCSTRTVRSLAANSTDITLQKIDGLYVNSYGNQSDPALIFVHGGPGYDSQDFEWSTAAKLAAKGFYVVVYDQRGQGRSDVVKDPKVYSYQQYADDIKLIIGQLNLKSPTLIGHSHGGSISLRFDQIYPGVISKIILVSSPVNFWKSLDSIRTNCIDRYSGSNDMADKDKIISDFAVLNNNPSIKDEIMATADIFQLGAKKPCDLYTPSKPNPDALELRKIVRQLHIPVVQENLYYPMGNFIIYEQYIHVDQTEWVKTHADHIFGIYGAEDGLFTKNVLAEIEADLSIGQSSDRFQLINGSSHAIYIDQQDKFLEAIIKIFKKN